MYNWYENTIQVFEEYLEKFKKQKKEGHFSKIEYRMTYKSFIEELKKFARKKFQKRNNS